MSEQEQIDDMMRREGQRVLDQIEVAKQAGGMTPGSTVLVAAVNGCVFSVTMPYLPHDPAENRFDDPSTYLDMYSEPEWKVGSTDPDRPLYEVLCDLSAYVTSGHHYKTDLTDVSDETHKDVLARVYSFLFWWLTKEAPEALDPETSVRVITFVGEPIRDTFHIGHWVAA